MKKQLLLVFCFVNFTVSCVFSQTNILSTNAAAELVMQGNYNPAAYQASVVIKDPTVISNDILSRVSPDSLHAYLEVLRTFKNRNSASDTTSATRGIGAARSWIYSKFQQFSSQNENRLLASYLQFDQAICTMGRHKNVMAVLPGTDTADKSIIIIEAHMDSRCADVCDTACLAEGMEDNGSGTALVMELARVMSKYSFNHTIVFTTVTAEEQGLDGSIAFAKYVQQKGIKVKAVLNNDVIGGIICGKTSSPPSCPGLNNIDSTQVRLFSFGGFNSFHKGLSRYIKLEYKEMVMPHAAVPMTVTIMSAEDRTGRSGDHIPFRQFGYPAMRFTSANEHGDANVTAAGYDDRQHTSSDVLGVDTNGDTILDSFFVDFNYLARNTVINGNAAAMIALSPVTPDFVVNAWNPNRIDVQITDQKQYNSYRVGVRTTSNDWDSVYTINGGYSLSIPVATGPYIISVASVDDKGVESLFSREWMVVTGVDNTEAQQNLDLLQNRPNPADEATIISVKVNNFFNYREAFITITDIAGKEVKRIPIVLKPGVNEVLYDHGYNMAGTYFYTLVVDGKPQQAKKMQFIN